MINTRVYHHAFIFIKDYINFILYLLVESFAYIIFKQSCQLHSDIILTFYILFVLKSLQLKYLLH
jgi:hypothetical protein